MKQNINQNADGTMCALRPHRQLWACIARSIFYNTHQTQKTHTHGTSGAHIQFTIMHAQQSTRQYKHKQTHTDNTHTHRRAYVLAENTHTHTTHTHRTYIHIKCIAFSLLSCMYCSQPDKTHTPKHTHIQKSIHIHAGTHLYSQHTHNTHTLIQHILTSTATPSVYSRICTAV